MDSLPTLPFLPYEIIIKIVSSMPLFKIWEILLSAINNEQDAYMDYILEALSDKKVLRITNEFKLEDLEKFFHLMPDNTKAERLEIDYFDYYNGKFDLRKFKKCKSIRFGKCLVREILIDISQITKLEFIETDFSENQYFLDKFLPKCTNLKELTLVSASHTLRYDFEGHFELTKLKIIDNFVSEPQFFTRFAIFLKNQANSLEELTLIIKNDKLLPQKLEPYLHSVDFIKLKTFEMAYTPISFTAQPVHFMKRIDNLILHHGEKSVNALYVLGMLLFKQIKTLTFVNEFATSEFSEYIRKLLEVAQFEGEIFFKDSYDYAIELYDDCPPPYGLYNRLN